MPIIMSYLKIVKIISTKTGRTESVLSERVESEHEITKK